MVFFKSNKITKIGKYEKVFCTKIIEFDAGHRVFDSDNEKCEKLHGHHYKIELTFSSNKLNNGMVIDFGVIKSKVGDWVCKNWDHNVILSSRDDKLANVISKETGQDVFLIENNATVEVMAMFLLNLCNETLFNNVDENVICEKVKIWESPTSFAEYRIKD